MKMFLNKKGDIWISAVIYIALGVIVLTLILSAGVPLVTKMKDRNTVMQTKSVMLALDNNIRAVATSGPGAQRLVNLDIGEGNLNVNDEDTIEAVHWEMTTKAKLQAPNTLIEEGYLSLNLSETRVVGEYVINLDLNYTDFANLTITEDSSVPPYKGSLAVYIKNIGNNKPIVGVTGRFDNLPVIQLQITA